MMILCKLFIVFAIFLLQYTEATQCGIQKASASKRIIRGTEATPNSWPWAVTLHNLLSDGKTLLDTKCGGRLLNLRSLKLHINIKL